MKKCLLMALAVSLLIMTGCSGGGEQEMNDTEETQEHLNGETDAGSEEVATNIDSDQAISIAESFIEQLSQGEYEEAAEYLNETMTDQIGPNELGEVWETLESQIGTYVDQDFNATEEVEEYLVVLLNGLFEGDDVVFTVTIDSNYEIAGFFVQ